MENGRKKANQMYLTSQAQRVHGKRTERSIDEKPPNFDTKWWKKIEKNILDGKNLLTQWN